METVEVRVTSDEGAITLTVPANTEDSVDEVVNAALASYHEAARGHESPGDFLLYLLTKVALCPTCGVTH